MFEMLFSFSNPVVFFWILLIFLPKWRLTQLLAKNIVFPIYLATVYTIGVVMAIADQGLSFVQDFGSAQGVIHLLAQPSFALLSWIHILCFDQAIGHFIYQDNMKNRYIPLPVQSVILFGTLMLGPLGFLTYIIVRTVCKAENREN